MHVSDAASYLLLGHVTQNCPVKYYPNSLGTLSCDVNTLHESDGKQWPTYAPSPFTFHQNSKDSKYKRRPHLSTGIVQFLSPANFFHLTLDVSPAKTLFSNI